MNQIQNPPAFARPCSVDNDTDYPQTQYAQTGMSLWDYFAGQALQGCLAYSHCSPTSGNWQENSGVDCLAKHCYRVANAMLKARQEMTVSYKVENELLRQELQKSKQMLEGLTLIFNESITDAEMNDKLRQVDSKVLETIDSAKELLGE